MYNRLMQNNLFLNFKIMVLKIKLIEYAFYIFSVRKPMVFRPWDEWRHFHILYIFYLKHCVIW